MWQDPVIVVSLVMGKLVVCCGGCRLQKLESALTAREREINQLREQLQQEIKAEAQHAAGKAAELAGERAALQKQAAVLEQEKEEFKHWKQETKEELQKQLKVCLTLLLMEDVSGSGDPAKHVALSAVTELVMSASRPPQSSLHLVLLLCTMLACRSVRMPYLSCSIGWIGEQQSLRNCGRLPRQQ